MTALEHTLFNLNIYVADMESERIQLKSQVEEIERKLETTRAAIEALVRLQGLEK